MRSPTLCAVAVILFALFVFPVLSTGQKAASHGDSPEDEARMMIALPSEVRPRGVLLAAPHAGFDLHTEKVAQDVGERVGAPTVIAWNYRKPGQLRFFNVNRPTEEKVEKSGARGPEKQTAAANEVFAEWIEWVRKAAGRAGVPATEPVPLYVEIHGNNRRIQTPESGELVVDRVEVATVGFRTAELKALEACWQEERKANASLPAIAFDDLHPHYKQAGVRVSFYFRASGAREEGILRAPHVSRALHFELPRRARSSRSTRAAVAAAISRVLEKAMTFSEESTVSTTPSRD